MTARPEGGVESSGREGLRGAHCLSGPRTTAQGGPGWARGATEEVRAVCPRSRGEQKGLSKFTISEVDRASCKDIWKWSSYWYLPKKVLLLGSSMSQNTDKAENGT